jgi:hypothetical protein
MVCRKRLFTAFTFSLKKTKPSLKFLFNISKHFSEFHGPRTETPSAV